MDMPCIEVFWSFHVNWHLSLVEEYVAEIPVRVVQVPVHAFMEFFLKKKVEKPEIGYMASQEFWFVNMVFLCPQIPLHEEIGL